MDIIHTVNRLALPRSVTSGLIDRLTVMPAVVITGSRQTGKSTLVQDLLPGYRQFFTFDDLDVLEVAKNDPEVLVGGSLPITLDEIQREPKILIAVKRAIDRNRQPGQFLLTGSANLLLMGHVSESLAGRASYLTLWPMTRREQLGLGQCGLWDELMSTQDKDWLDVINAIESKPEDWKDLARRGGFPTPAVQLASDESRAIWFDGYVRTYLERDLQELSRIDALPDFRRLMRAACHRIGGLINQTEIARDLALAQPTVHRYLNLLETSYMLVRLPSYSVNKTKRLIKTPKLYWGDTGLALYLAGVEEPNGEYLENLVLNDLITWRDSRKARAEIFYWRTTIGEEVDFVVETDEQLLPIEIKATSRPQLRDIKHLRSFRAEYKDAARAAILLHAGDTTEWIAPDVLAAPWWKII